MKPIIKAENVSKQYRIGAAEANRQSLREILGAVGRNPFKQFRRMAGSHSETIWALRNVSFEVQQGEVLGFIGPNGAGKSTLLKILSRITEPTEGRIEIYGKVGSLLEVGTGFHPELTGRENIFLNGAILGMGRSEIGRKFDEIVAFSEVGKFIDTPVKHYSSGMYMRLAFAVAAHLEPEILIVDEVLSVGDNAFQKKCLGKMGEVAKEGRTVLFVSHSMLAVQSLCERVFWLDHGEIVESGPARRVIANYFKSSAVMTETSEEVWTDLSSAPGNEMVRLHRIRIRAQSEAASELLTMQTPFLIDVEYWNLQPNTELHITLALYTDQDIIAFATGSASDSQWKDRGMPAGMFRSTCYVPGNLLNAGRHRFSVYVVKDESLVIYEHRSAVSFDIVDLRERKGSWFGREPGVVNPSLRWTTTQMDACSANSSESEELSTVSGAK
jgi:lipopolysaccharide transport system ATP-binding protein